MFSTLMPGSILYGIDTRDSLKYFAAPVEKVTPPRQNISSTNISQFPQMVVDITANINGTLQEFKQVPSNTSIADFGQNSVVLADSRESLTAYITSKRQQSIKIIESENHHKNLVKQYDKVLKEMNPNSIAEDTVTTLNNRITSLESQLAEAIALLKGNNKQ